MLNINSNKRVFLYKVQFQKMKNYFLTMSFLLLYFITYSQSYKKKYKEQLEPNSKLLKSGFNYTAEKVNDTLYIFKRYYPETKVVTHYASFSADNFSYKNGLYIERYDNGVILAKGYYKKNKKYGEWIESVYKKGNYQNGLKHGKWITTTKPNSYLKGQLGGVLVEGDSILAAITEEEYKEGKLISTTADTILAQNGIMPRFPGCEEMEGGDKAKQKCSEKKLLQFLYGNLKYPRRSREDEIQGIGLIQFMIDKEGNVTKVNPLRGITREIRAECIRVIKKMPQWRPGYQRGEPVNVLYTLPISFRIKK